MTITRNYRGILTGALSCALIGCGAHHSIEATAPPPTPFAKSASTEFFRTDDPCNLLQPQEVEAVLGPLAVAPYRSGNGTNPTPSGDSCVYETANFRYISLQVVREGGSRVYSLTGMVSNLLKQGGGNAEIQNNVRKNFKLDDGTEIAGAWDEASLTPMNCCIFQALRGDQLIIVDFTPSRATLKQAAELVDKAYQRLEQPLKIDGGGAVVAAKALDKTRPKPVDVCTLLTSDQLAAILGPLPSPPESHGHDGCAYQVAPMRRYELTVHWREGYRDWRADRHTNTLGGAAIHQIAGDVGVQQGVRLAPNQVTPGPAPVAASGDADPAETVSDDGMRFVVVKRDVEVRVNNSFNDPVKAQALIAAAIAKL